MDYAMAELDHWAHDTFHDVHFTATEKRLTQLRQGSHMISTKTCEPPRKQEMLHVTAQARHLDLRSELQAAMLMSLIVLTRLVRCWPIYRLGYYFHMRTHPHSSSTQLPPTLFPANPRTFRRSPMFKLLMTMLPPDRMQQCTHLHQVNSEVPPARPKGEPAAPRVLSRKLVIRPPSLTPAYRPLLRHPPASRSGRILLKMTMMKFLVPTMVMMTLLLIMHTRTVSPRSMGLELMFLY